MRRAAARLAVGVVVVAAAGGAGWAAADEAKTRTTARDVLRRYGDAVITLRLRIKSRMVYQGQERGTSESTLEIAGTILTPEGLTVVSDAASNPAAMFQGGDGPKVETETSDVKLVMRDGREIPGHFAVRDNDLDLAFVVPDEKGLTLPAVTLERGPAPDPLDDLIILSPLGKTLDHAPSVSVAKVRAVVNKPRTFLVAATFFDGLQGLGCPAFDESGRAVGLVVMRRSPTPPTGQNGIRDMMEMLSPVVLTSADVLDVAAQAKAAKEPAR